MQDLLNNVYRLQIQQWNPGQSSTNNQTALNAAQGIGAQILGVGRGLCLLRRTSRSDVLRIRAGHHAESNRHVGDVSRDRAGVVAQPVERTDPGDADQAAGRHHADDRARRGGHPDRVRGVGAGAEKRQVRGHRRDRAA